MKSLKLWIHKSNINEDVLFCQEALPGCNVGDVIEIHHPGEDISRLLVQVKTINVHAQGSYNVDVSAISVQENVAKLFQLQSHRGVQVRKVPLEDVQLDLVVLVLKDQYIGRSDMYRLRQSLVGSCVFVGKKLSYCGMRATVRELWRKDCKMMCGSITENTRVVYRSASAAMVFLVQLSCEMWQFNKDGDLFMETAITGFFADLLSHWKKQQCSHQVTVVLFSRLLYTKQEHDCMLAKHKQRLTHAGGECYYQDLYRVIVDSEIRSDWSSLLKTLRLAFADHSKSMLQQKAHVGCGVNSAAHSGNILEALNVAMNVYGRHYLDCNFERNGQQVIVVTPGIGVYEVDKELMTLTKRRVIELGVGADLVCLAEQPLHQVPLFVFSTPSGANPYSIPHWINHSFYCKEQSQDSSYAKFHPRIQIPCQFSPIGFQKSCLHDSMLVNSPEPGDTRNLMRDRGRPYLPCGPVTGTSESSVSAEPTPTTAQVRVEPSHTDFDRYDNAVFIYHPRNEARRKRCRSNRGTHSKSTDDLSQPTNGDDSTEQSVSVSRSLVGSPPMAVPSRRISGVLSDGSYSTSPKNLVSQSFNTRASSGQFPAVSKSQASMSTSVPKSKSFQLPSLGHAHPSSTGSAKAVSRTPSAEQHIINPFSSRGKSKMTANSARWRETFPTDDCGKPMKEHHALRKDSSIIPENGEEEVIFTVADTPPDGKSDTEEERRRLERIVFQAGHAAVAARNASTTGSGDEVVLSDSAIVRMPSVDEELGTTGRSAIASKTKASSGLMSSYHSSKKFMWAEATHGGALNDIDFLDEISMDWRSLVEPACLPLGTDFFPENLAGEFVESQYTLFYDDEKWGTQTDRIATDLSGHPDLSERQIFYQLVLQRVGQGFQLVRQKSKGEKMEVRLETGQPMALWSEYWAILGQHIHHLQLSSPIIEIKRFKPRHQFATAPVLYQFSLSCDSLCCSEMHNVQFAHPTLDEYNWNYLDQYVCGDRSFCDLLESLKYWRCCFLLLPGTTSKTSSSHSQMSQANSPAPDDCAGTFPPLNAHSRVSIHEPADSKDSAFAQAGDEDSARLSPKTCVRNFVRFVDLLNRLRRQSKSKAVRYVVQLRTPDELSTAGGGSSLNLPTTTTVAPGLDTSSALGDIRKAMLGPNGVDVLDSVAELPANTFVALDGVDWFMTHVYGLENRQQAAAVAQRMVDVGFIRHASGDASVAYLDGLHFYSIVADSKDSAKGIAGATGGSSSSGGVGGSAAVPPSSSQATSGCEDSPLEHFHNAWFEVTLPESCLSRRASSFMHCGGTSPQAPSSLVTSQEAPAADQLSLRLPVPLDSSQGGGEGWLKRNLDYYDAVQTAGSSGAGPAMAVKTMVTQLHAHGRSDMPEWCTLHYPTNYEPNCAFHFEIQWMVATGCLVNELVQGWARKANSCNFHLLPAPVRPFDKTVHPLHCGSFVRMPIESVLTAEEKGAITIQTVLQVQSLLLERLLFLAVPHLALPSAVDPRVKSDEHLQGIPYVHQSGVGFAQPVIEDVSKGERQRHSSFSSILVPSLSDEESENDDRKKNARRFSKVGFLFMPNIMLTGRWKTPTADTPKSVCEQLRNVCSDVVLLRQLLDQVEITMT